MTVKVHSGLCMKYSRWDISITYMYKMYNHGLQKTCMMYRIVYTKLESTVSM